MAPRKHHTVCPGLQRYLKKVSRKWRRPYVLDDNEFCFERVFRRGNIVTFQFESYMTDPWRTYNLDTKKIRTSSSDMLDWEGTYIESIAKHLEKWPGGDCCIRLDRSGNESVWVCDDV
jgi:hypothetical protein